MLTILQSNDIIIIIIAIIIIAIITAQNLRNIIIYKSFPFVF